MPLFPILYIPNDTDNATERHTIFILPHQDDELLTMGAYAAKLAYSGGSPHALLCTDGSASRVRGILNNGQFCNKHEGRHQYQMGIDAFCDARDHEFFDSCCALGFRPSQILAHPQRDKDGQLSVEKAERLVSSYLQLFGKEQVTVCTVSPFVGESQHTDHRALGEAAVRLYRKKRIKELLLFVEPYCLEGFRENNPQVQLVETRPTEEEKVKLAKAVAAYSLWEPNKERYAVGYHSVGRQFDDFVRDPVSYHHTLEDIAGSHRSRALFSRSKSK